MPSTRFLSSLLLIAPLACGLCGCRTPQPGPNESRPADPDQRTKPAPPPSGAVQPKEPGSTPPASAAKKAPAPGTVLYLHRWVEPREQAFSILLPAGWIAEGGVLRIDPRLGPTNSVGAKIDFSVRKDRAGSVMIHWLPNFTYKDPRALGGMFAVGSNYMGAMVYPVLDPQTFMDQFVFRKQRPEARNVRVLERKPLSELAQRYRQRSAVPNARYDAGSVTVAYDEGGVQYKERLMAVIEDIEGQGLGMWTNHETLAVRAPVAEFDQSAGLLGAIESSLKGNPAWVSGENRGAAARAHNALETQRTLQNQRHQMVERQRETNAEARHSSWLFLTGQDDYVNPHTGEVEQGSNEYRNRWVNSGGDVIYSNDPDYDPSWDTNLAGRSDYKLSPLRQR